MSRDHGPELRIGTSGYQYKHWKGIFYPPSVRSKDWFRHYADHFDSVEINNTFYRLPELKTFQAWRERTPAGFCYALKYSRYGSHLMHLKDPEQHLKPFLTNSKPLEPYLGPILVQLPPKWRVDLDRLEQFLAAAPRQRKWALEFRNPSWLCADVYALLRRHGAALCIHDMIPEHPAEITAGWTYLRYHGGRYEGNYSAEQLKQQAGRIRHYLAAGVAVFAYFNNDLQGHALMNAADLRELVTGRPNLLRELQWFW